MTSCTTPWRVHSHRYSISSLSSSTVIERKLHRHESIFTAAAPPWKVMLQTTRSIYKEKEKKNNVSPIVIYPTPCWLHWPRTSDVSWGGLCEEAGIRISTSKSEATLLTWKEEAWPLQARRIGRACLRRRSSGISVLLSGDRRGWEEKLFFFFLSCCHVSLMCHFTCI